MHSLIFLFFFQCLLFSFRKQAGLGETVYGATVWCFISHLMHVSTARTDFVVFYKSSDACKYSTFITLCVWCSLLYCFALVCIVIS